MDKKKQVAIVSIVLAAIAGGLGLTWKYKDKVGSKLGFMIPEETVA